MHIFSEQLHFRCATIKFSVFCRNFHFTGEFWSYCFLNYIQTYFYLPHMEYEGSIGFVTEKMKKNIADFHVLGLFMAKNMI
jgi:hypothetical protein